MYVLQLHKSCPLLSVKVLRYFLMAFITLVTKLDVATIQT